jgi:protein required for attachment to host cells
MVQHRIPCFVIADGGHARFVWPAEDNALRTREAMDSTTATKQTSDLVSDRAGRSFESASPSRHGITPRNDPHEMEKQKFARVVGDKVCELNGEAAFTEVILVAPAAVLAGIKDALDTATGLKIAGELAKDLVKVPDHELWPHLKQWVRPVQRL